MPEKCRNLYEVFNKLKLNQTRFFLLKREENLQLYKTHLIGLHTYLSSFFQF